MLLFLEVEADGKLQLPHGRAALQSRNLAIVAALAIDTAVSPVVLAESIDGVIENVESIHAELRAESFRDLELLHRRQIGVEARRAMVGVAAEVAEVPDARIGEDSRVGDDVGNRGEVSNGVGDRVKRTQLRCGVCPNPC